MLLQYSQNFQDILMRKKRSLWSDSERYTNGKRYSPVRFLTRSVRENEISSETYEETRKRQQR